MRPQTKTRELPSAYKVKNNVHNEFDDFIERIKTEINDAPGNVSILWDMWTAKHTSNPFLGLMARWVAIDAQTGAWSLRDEVIGCYNVFGEHTGDNLGKYLTMLLDRVGITSRTEHKVSIDCIYINLLICAL